MAWAKRQLGLPYRWGGAGPNSYDCSGLTMRAWQRAGVHLPHYAASQYRLSTKVPYSAMRPGDLIFYARDTSRSSTIHHVTMFVGNGKMIEAPMTGLNVRIVPIRWNGTMATELEAEPMAIAEKWPSPGPSPTRRARSGSRST